MPLTHGDEDVSEGVDFDEISVLFVEPKTADGKSVVVLKLGNGIRVP